MATSLNDSLRLFAGAMILALTLTVSGCKTVENPGRSVSPQLVLELGEHDLQPLVDLACSPIILESALELARYAKRRLSHPVARITIEAIIASVREFCKDAKREDMDRLMALQQQLFAIQKQIEEQSAQQERLAEKIEADRQRRERADAARDELARQRHQKQLDAIRREGEETRRRLEERFKRRATCGEYRYQIDGFCYDARTK